MISCNYIFFTFQHFIILYSFFLHSLYFCYLFCSLSPINPIYILFVVYMQSKHFFSDIYRIRARSTSSVFEISSWVLFFFIKWWKISGDICLILTAFYSEDDLELDIFFKETCIFERIYILNSRYFFRGIRVVAVLLTFTIMSFYEGLDRVSFIFVFFNILGIFSRPYDDL